MATASLPIRQEPRISAGLPRVGEFLRWSVDHKIIGVQYMVVALSFFFIGGILAMLMRWELLTPDVDFFGDGAVYNSAMTMHGTIMIFLWMIPMIGAMGNYVVPLQIGARDMAFPWLNAFAFWIIPPAGTLMLLGWLVGPAEAGWTSYPPLSLLGYDGQLLWALSLHLLGISSILGAINFIVTIINMRPEGMPLFRMPLLCWAVLATALIIVLATPFLAGALTLLILDMVAGTSFFIAAQGGDVLLWQNVFWFYSHPAVYIMVLPSMGIISEVLSVHSRKPVFGYRMIALSSMSIALVGFTVWAHHMFTSLTPELRIPFMITSMIIAVPTGIKIFSWLATIWGGKIRFTSAMNFALGFLSLFLIGGLTGIIVGSVPVDIHLHDTYFVVSHFHFTLYGGGVMGLFAGVYHWWPKITGRMLSERLGRWHFWLTFIGFLWTFLPQQIAGMWGMPRRVASYDPSLQLYNQLSSLGAFVLGASALFFFYNLGWSLVRGKVAGGNPWRALTLEWATTSPPPALNFYEDPVPFANPYGYGSDEAVEYLDEQQRRFPAAINPQTEEGVALASSPATGSVGSAD